MPVFQLLVVAILQGITEFLPVSSSGHLILLPALTGFEDQGLAIDVAVHVGTLGAVVLYFWSDLRLALLGIPPLLCGRIEDPGARLALCLAVATIPVAVAGFVVELAGWDQSLRSVAVIAWATIAFGLVLLWADRRGATVRRAEDWTLRHAMIMGVWQTLALIPGTSRSGITMSAGRLLGYTREDAARVSMLMSIPTITASAILLGIDVATEADTALARDGAIAAALAFAAALVALKLMFRLLQSVSFTPYVVYRLCLGVVLLWIAYG